ncbi:hypothetical protein [Paenibacillus dokdonensis]|uniref:hypothetical protein n=1 Tax=Paenibacillus dokdonensis TaxID=2567944 RepID=UPI003D2A2858
MYEADAAAELPEHPEFQFSISDETYKRRQQMMSRWVRNTAEQRFSGTREEFLSEFLFRNDCPIGCGNSNLLE